MGTELAAAITTADRVGKVGDDDSGNTCMAFLEAWLRAIGAVNGNEAKVDYWGSTLDPRMPKHVGGDLLETFLCKYFVMCYSGNKLLGEDRIETATDTSKGTKVFALAGKIKRGGLIEVPMGTTIREIVEGRIRLP